MFVLLSPSGIRDTCPATNLIYGLYFAKYLENARLILDVYNIAEFVSLPQYEIQYMDMIHEQGEYCTLTYKIIRISFKAIYTGIVAGLMKGMCVAFLRLVLSMCIDVSQV